MRWSLSLVLACSTIACSPSPEQKEEPKLEVHAQPAFNLQATPKEELPPGAQTFHEGMLALCESFEKAPKSDDPLESQKLLHAWLSEKVTNAKVREVFELVGSMPPSQRSGMLRTAAAKVGITSCALAGPDPIMPAAPADGP